MMDFPKGTGSPNDVCVRLGQGFVPERMQLGSKYKPRAACEPLLNMKEENFPDELARQLCGALRGV